MSTLKEWNDDRQRYWDDRLRQARHPEEFPNGLVCPLGPHQLYDDHQTQQGPPPKIKVRCMDPSCKFSGWRLS